MGPERALARVVRASARIGWVCSMTALGPGLAACSGEKAPEAVAKDTPATVQVSFGSLIDLGSFVFQTSTLDERTNAGRTLTRESACSLKWRDRDHWEYETLTDGKPATHWLVNAGQAWEGLSGGPLAPKGDPEPLRAELALAWDPWEEIVAITAGRIEYGPGTPENVGGRATMRHELALAPVPAGKKLPRHPRGEALEPVSLTGTLWVDTATSVRILADVTATAASPDTPQVAPDGTTAPSGIPPERTRRLAVKLAVTGLGEDPGVAAPPSSTLAPP